MKPTQIRVQAQIHAPIDPVWDVWTQPQHITQWNFASPDWCCPRASNDLKVGGKYSARMEARDGSFGFDFEAIYDEVIEGKRLAYTLGDGRKVATEFENLGASTQVTTVFDAETENPVEMQRAGWQAILNEFKKYVEKLAK